MSQNKPNSVKYAPIQHANVTFNALGIPIADQFDDIYFNNENGLAETNYVFLQHNGLPERWQTPRNTPFTIAETGFGTGLNFLACWDLFERTAPASQRLHYVSFEKYPMAPTDIAQAMAAFPHLSQYCQALLEAYPAPHAGCHRIQFHHHRVTLDLWFGDLHEQLPHWLPYAQQTVDAWFLDGFAPDKNPQMWQDSLYQAMAASCREQGTFATFTAAGSVRRGLQAAGFEVKKSKGFGHKREMLHGMLPTATPSVTPAARPDPGVPVTIVGGGIAAACVAWSLTQRGYQVHLLSEGIADGASGNAQGAVYPLLQVELSPLSRFHLSAFDHARQFYQGIGKPYWHGCGMVQLATQAKRLQRQQKLAEHGVYAPTMVTSLEADQTQQIWAELPAVPSLWYPSSGWVAPPQLVHHLLTQCGERLTVQQGVSIQAVTPTTDGGWRLTSEHGEEFHAHTLILAAGAGLLPLLQQWHIATEAVRGQVTQVAANSTSQECPVVVCYKGYFTPVLDSETACHCVGATYQRQFDPQHYRELAPEDTATNLAQLQSDVQQPWTHNLVPVADRAALRHTTRDHLPMAGWLSASLGIIGGLSSRGFTSAPLCAELLVSQWLGEPLPLSAELVKRLAPERLQDGEATLECAPYL
ncbi:tRNA 5-methylaminomethyl-2-thiouridine biosynthesis bifunctional protein [Pseudidiomarina indica]|uniref:tRNA 5-methylaminomethyl-2-thiouridine biosynthesis bifunctional protein MnmC n=1 Tax=Pseudidiomarina indica TaxID=1159017 RepID=A0A1G6DS06_9GAMM|nr:bifunctional tRNA (5-methylaminomethyl-2-thiouridine)(34)-methyltransferase MnmD/FAD-dependent 5-carboxymethylaminomethyl-2-thiouridine(34) oxidoreductase MnmC [Pseudidiomarina indica]SDB47906.1 tRNA 5-methylaminomethyl-2-thiouridine biosynthesis bifunctional protein [Pseudidiomarina indica]